MKFGVLFLSFIMNASLATASVNQSIPLKVALSNMELLGKQGLLLTGENCSATYEVDNSLEKLIVTVKKTVDGQEVSASDSFGPEVFFKPFLGSYALSGVAPTSNSNLVYSSNLKEVRVANIYVDQDTVVQCVASSLPSANETRGIVINLTSNGASFDAAAEKAFYNYVGTQISNQLLDQFKVTGYGDEGGKFYCLEINSAFHGTKLENVITLLLKELREQVVPAQGTTFSMSLKKNCN